MRSRSNVPPLRCPGDAEADGAAGRRILERHGAAAEVKQDVSELVVARVAGIEQIALQAEIAEVVSEADVDARDGGGREGAAVVECQRAAPAVDGAGRRGIRDPRVQQKLRGVL